MGKPDESLIYVLQKAAKRAVDDLEAALADVELTARQFLLLALVAKNESRSQSDLAAMLDVDPAVLVKLTDQLEARRLLTRARFADDRRQHRLALTDAGRTLLGAAETRYKKAERAYTRAIGPRRADLVALLSALVNEHP